MDVSKFKLEDYKIVKHIGRGTFGKVYLVKNNHTNQYFAMKSIRKDVVLQHESLESLKVEKLILLQVQHPFIISMEQVFSSETRIYFVMQFVQGGELFKHLSEQRRFSEDRVKFYAAQIALALGYLHKSNIYYRDLKPEMIVGSGHDHTLDWWALGVLIYEMIIGIPPFYHKNQHQMYQLIQQAPLRWPDPQKHKINVSDDAKDLINMLLQKDRKKRLGQLKDAEEVLSHKFFEGLDLKKLLAREIQAEFIPDQNYIKNFDSEIVN